MIKKAIKKIKGDNERGARHALMDELFYDFHRSRHQVYWMNFTRGLFFGFGTVLGGTVLVTLIIWILGQFVGYLPDFIGHYINQIIEAMQHSK
ncbi:MAG: DUF5665 domain-containing protein [Candidatus Saccharimonadales bacterium]